MPPWLPSFPLFLGLALFAAGGEAPPTARLSAHVRAHPDGRAPLSLDLSVLRGGPHPELPIGVFDSGIGGLTVLEALLSLDAVDNRTLRPGPDGLPDLAGERFIYLGDQANMPYGNYPAAGKEGYLRELILKDAIFLLGRRHRRAPGAKPTFDKPPVKALVVACNTATAYGLEDIRTALKEWGIDIPVIGVVEAGAEAVAERLPSDGSRSVGVMATVGTCASGAYPAAIAKAAARAGKPVPFVLQRGSVGLAAAIEGNPGFVGAGPGTYQGPAEDPEAARLGGVGPEHLRPEATWALASVEGHLRFDVGGLLAGLRAHPEAPPMELVVLGCTHFPLVAGPLRSAFKDGAPRLGPGRVGPDLGFVDPAEQTARALLVALDRRGLRRSPASRRPPKVSAFYLSVPDPGAPGVRLGRDGALDPTYQFQRSEGSPTIEDTVVVPLTPRTLPSASRALVRSLPRTWAAFTSAASGAHP